jgi:predicted esterase
MLHELNFQYKARYHRLGELNKSTEQVWWVFHGYGQLSQFFIQKFNPLVDKNISIIAPEGLSKFYLAGNSGRVGASWMTRENRQMDIENYIAYLDNIAKTENPLTEIPTTILGFSQGAATATRWALSGKIKFDRLILWAGLFPPDIDFEIGGELLKKKEIIEVIGKQDQFITQDKIDEMHKLNQKLRITPAIIEFDGKHEINEEVLMRIASN